jgi:poly(A) polymerase
MDARLNWLNVPFIKQLVGTLGHDNIRFVGGAVRDSLIGRPIQDIDAATSLRPDDVIARLRKASISVIPTGLDHGTVTAHSKDLDVEITTLRVDEETDGRRAKVAFTSDWSVDASRRDFTMNAIYVDSMGNVFDPFHGQEDLAEGRVVFIGNAEARIREDALRILRFFRFNAWFAAHDMDPDGLLACKCCKDLITSLSMERVRDEFIKLLCAPNPVSVFMSMIDMGVAAVFLPDVETLDKYKVRQRLETLIQTENELEVKPNPWARLVCIYGPQYEGYRKLGQRFKFSKKQMKILTQICQATVFFEEMMMYYEDASLTHKVLVYRFGREVYQLFFLLNSSLSIRFKKNIFHFEKMKTWVIPIFPVGGNDLMKHGWKQGPEIADTLRFLEDQWIKSNFSLTKEQLVLNALDQK